MEALVAVEAAVEGDFADADAGALQQGAGALDFLPADLFVNAVAADFFEVDFQSAASDLTVVGDIRHGESDTFTFLYEVHGIANRQIVGVVVGYGTPGYHGQGLDLFRFVDFFIPAGRHEFIQRSRGLLTDLHAVEGDAG